MELGLQANWAGKFNLKMVLLCVSLPGCCLAGSSRLNSLSLRACGPTLSTYACYFARSEHQLKSSFQRSQSSSRQVANLAYLTGIDLSRSLGVGLQVTSRGASQLALCFKGRPCIVIERMTTTPKLCCSVMLQGIASLEECRTDSKAPTTHPLSNLVNVRSCERTQQLL